MPWSTVTRRGTFPGSSEWSELKGMESTVCMIGKYNLFRSIDRYSGAGAGVRSIAKKKELALASIYGTDAACRCKKYIRILIYKRNKEKNGSI